MDSKKTKLINHLKKYGGIASYAEIVKAGFNKELLKICLVSGQITKIDRGLYRISEGFQLVNPDIVAVAIKVPKGVICLLSALVFHEATDEIPRCVDIAIPRGTHANKINYPPVRFFRFSQDTWKTGVEDHNIGGHKVRVYNLAKTIADCFKFRNRIGINIARQALRTAVSEKGVKPKEIIHYAKICRVDSIVKPILETMI